MKIDIIKIVEMFSRAIDESITENIDLLNLENKTVKYPKFHQFKVACFSVHLAKELGLTDDEIKDIFLLGLFHDVGFISSEIVPTKYSDAIILDYEAIVNHCLLGEKLINTLNFTNDIKNVIKYHHEHYDGTGFFEISGEDIPLYSRILAIGNGIDLFYNLDYLKPNFEHITKFIQKEAGKTFDPNFVEASLKVLENQKNSDFSTRCDLLPTEMIEVGWSELKNITESFMQLIDHKSNYTFKHSTTITSYVDKLTDLYGFSEEHKIKMLIAANLHDIGKVSIPQTILEKPQRLKESEYVVIKNHSMYGELMLKDIENFEDISKWIGQHHEKLNKTGYPRRLGEEEIEFESQILAVCDVFTALMEDRPYRYRLRYSEAKKILLEMGTNNEINLKVAKDLLNLFEKVII